MAKNKDVVDGHMLNLWCDLYKVIINQNLFSADDKLKSSILYGSLAQAERTNDLTSDFEQSIHINTAAKSDRILFHHHMHTHTLLAYIQ